MYLFRLADYSFFRLVFGVVDDLRFVLLYSTKPQSVAVVVVDVVGVVVVLQMLLV